MAPGFGSFKPKNTLNRDNQSSVVQRNPAFNLHDGYDRRPDPPNKKQKADESAKEARRSTTFTIEIPASKHKSEIETKTKKSPNTAHSTHAEIESSSEAEFFSIHDSLSPQSPNYPRPGDAKELSNQKSKSPEPQRIGNSRNDFATSSTAAKSSKQAINESGPHGSRSSRPSENQNQDPRQLKHDVSTPEATKYFQGRDSQPQKKAESRNPFGTVDPTRNRDRVNTFNDQRSRKSNNRSASSHPNQGYESEDELLHSEPKVSIHQLDKVSPKDRKTAITKTSQKPPSLETRGDIQVTEFGSSKTAKPIKSPKLQEFKVIQLFSPIFRWVSEYESSWTLILDTNNRALKLRDPKGAVHGGGLVFRIQSLLRVKNCLENGKLLIHKSKDIAFRRSSDICMELETAEESADLMEAIRPLSATIGQSTMPKAHMERVFENINTKRELALKTASRGKNGDDYHDEEGEITSLQRKIRAQESRMVADELETEKPSNITSHTEDIQPCPRKKGLARAMMTPSSPDLAPQPPKSVSIPANDFYGKSIPKAEVHDGIRPTTRSMDKSSERFTTTRRSPSPKRWTKMNPNWSENWQGSIIYPREGKNKTSVDKQDIERLDEGEFLNDNLIAFYMRWLQHHLESTDPELAKRIYFHNSFFYKTLTQTTKRNIDYRAVERWTARVDLLSYDYIIVPVNEAAHWYVAIICNAPKLLSPEEDVESSKEAETDVIEKTTADGQSISPSANVHVGIQEMSLNEENEKKPEEEPDAASTSVLQNQSALKASFTNSPSTKLGKKKSTGALRKVDPTQPRIVTLDSLGLRHSPTCTNLKDYLVAEAKSKKGLDITITGPIGLTALNIPQQDNYCDCGLYVLGYIEKFLEDPDQFMRHIMQKDMDINITWLKASDMRNRIRDILFDLQKEQLEEARRQEAEQIRAKRIQKYDEKSKDPSPAMAKEQATPKSVSKSTTPEPSRQKVSARKDQDEEVLNPAAEKSTVSDRAASHSVKDSSEGGRRPQSSGNPKEQSRTVQSKREVVEITESPIKKCQRPHDREPSRKRSASPSPIDESGERKKKRIREKEESTPQAPLLHTPSVISVDSQEDHSANLIRVREEEDDRILFSSQQNSAKHTKGQKRKHDVIIEVPDDDEPHRRKRLGSESSIGKPPTSPIRRRSVRSVPSSPISSTATPQSSKRHRHVVDLEDKAPAARDGLDKMMVKGHKRRH
ncbi:hypothetical protein F5884DRAFT_801150 [Xylogone sp. PMI_703]|nr:hypothetical protein F5884DRAFT_801150 [Xylogone sp. PMI_703]